MWTYLADRFGAKRVLSLSMLAAIFVFLNAFFLSTGETSRFAVICVASGATLGQTWHFFQQFLHGIWQKLARGPKWPLGFGILRPKYRWHWRR